MKPQRPTSKTNHTTFKLAIPKRPGRQGYMLGCGMGDFGQLGTGLEECKRPTLLPAIGNVVDICAGGLHTLALTDEGIVYSFGCNDEGALGRKIRNEDDEFQPGRVQLPRGAVRISAGDSHSACLLEDGTVMAWGSFRDSHGSMGLNEEGKKCFPISILPGIKCARIASGADHLAISSCAGQIYTVGCGQCGQLGRVSMRSATGDGRRGNWELLHPSKVFLRRCKSLDDIWATNYCTFVRDALSDRIFGFGLNNYRQLAFPNEADCQQYPVVTDFADVRTISGGQHHTMVLKKNATVHVIGRHDYGPLGLGEINEDVRNLTPIEGALEGKCITDIACGDVTSFAITREGELYSWGMGTNFQLGTSKKEDEWSPVHIRCEETENKCIIKASSGGQHSVFLVEAS